MIKKKKEKGSISHAVDTQKIWCDLTKGCVLSCMYDLILLCNISIAHLIAHTVHAHCRMDFFRENVLTRI